MPKQSQIFSDIIKQEQSISKQMREKYFKKLAKRQAKEAETTGHSLVDEMSARYEKKLTPAEKGKMTKAKNAAKKASAEKVKAQQIQLEKDTIAKHKKDAEMKDIYGRSPSSQH